VLACSFQMLSAIGHESWVAVGEGVLLRLYSHANPEKSGNTECIVLPGVSKYGLPRSEARFPRSWPEYKDSVIVLLL